MGATAATVRKIALALPGVAEGSSYGTTGYRVRGKLFARMRDDDETVVLRIDAAERDLLLEADPETFYITDHYRDHPWVLVRLAAVQPAELRELLEQAWLRRAPKKLAEDYERSA